MKNDNGNKKNCIFADALGKKKITIIIEIRNGTSQVSFKTNQNKQ